MKPLAGKLLVAAPQLQDPNFAQTVVLMLRHEDEGALGVILNRPGDKTVDDVWEMIDKQPFGRDQFVHVGGPVPGPLIALHNQEPLGESQVLRGLYMSMQRDSIEQLVQTPEAEFRLYSGHAGWGGGQLEGELTAGGWLTSAAVCDDVFAAAESLWKHVCNRIGRGIVAPNIRPEQIPPDPSVN